MGVALFYYFSPPFQKILATPLEAAPLYNNTLRESGCTENVRYVEGRKNQEPVSKRNCAKRVTWFNPPFSKNVITRVGQKFLKFIDKHFPVGSKVRKVFNSNTVKVSYGCMPSMGCMYRLTHGLRGNTGYTRGCLIIAHEGGARGRYN